jgi:hypothetical protein
MPYLLPVSATTDILPDSERRGFIGALPPRLRSLGGQAGVAGIPAC